MQNAQTPPGHRFQKTLKFAHFTHSMLLTSNISRDVMRLLANSAIFLPLETFPICAMHFLDEIFFFACAEKSLCSKKGLYVSTGFLIGKGCR